MLSMLFCVPQCAKDPGCCAVVSLCHGVCCMCLAHDMLSGQCIVCPYKDEDCLLQGTNNASSSVHEIGSHTHKNKLMSARIFSV